MIGMRKVTKSIWYDAAILCARLIQFEWIYSLFILTYLGYKCSILIDWQQTISTSDLVNHDDLDFPQNRIDKSCNRSFCQNWWILWQIFVLVMQNVKRTLSLTSQFIGLMESKANVLNIFGWPQSKLYIWSVSVFHATNSVSFSASLAGRWCEINESSIENLSTRLVQWFTFLLQTASTKAR